MRYAVPRMSPPDPEVEMEFSRSDRQRITHYGLTVDEYEQLASSGCSVCGVSSKVVMKPDVDPITLDVLGLLCNKCAQLLICRDSARYRWVADYLDRLNSPVTPITVDTDPCPFGPDFVFEPTKMTNQDIKQYMEWADRRDYG